METVMLIMLNFIEELLIRCITEFLKGWEVWLTKSNQRLTPLVRSDNTNSDVHVTVSYLGDCPSPHSAIEPNAAAAADDGDDDDDDATLTSRRGYLALYQRPGTSDHDRWKNRRR